MTTIPITFDNSNNSITKTSSTNNIPVTNTNNNAQFSQMFANNMTNANNAGNTSSVAGGSGFSSGNSLSSGCAELDAMFEAAGRQYNINPNLLKAVAQVESNFRPDATSPAGAMGIMQIMPSTARHLGVTDPFDPLQSILGGARYLREQLDRFNGDIRLALAAYNAGWPAVQQHGGIPPFPETQAYLGVGMCFVMVWSNLVVGIVIGVVGIVALLSLIPLIRGFKENAAAAVEVQS